MKMDSRDKRDELKRPDWAAGAFLRPEPAPPAVPLPHLDN